MSRTKTSSKPRSSTRSPRSTATTATSSPPSGSTRRRTTGGRRPPRERLEVKLTRAQQLVQYCRGRLDRAGIATENMRRVDDELSTVVRAVRELPADWTPPRGVSTQTTFGVGDRVELREKYREQPAGKLLPQTHDGLSVVALDGRLVVIEVAVKGGTPTRAIVPARHLQRIAVTTKEAHHHE